MRNDQISRMSSGRWVRRGREIILLPDGVASGGMEGETGPIPATQQGVIHPAIDVHAQHALMRMSKGDAAAQADAWGMLGTVRGNRLGIYKEDQQKPALRAKKLGGAWWTAVPAGEDATVLADPSSPEPPFIIFRDRVKNDPTRLDPALRKAWARFLALGGRGCLIPRGVLDASRKAAVQFQARQGSWASLAPSPPPLPRLSLWQNHRFPDHAHFFETRAMLWAAHSRSVAVETESTVCTLSTGPTRFNSGHDIVEAFSSAYHCLGFQRLQQVHVYSHSTHQLVRGRESHNGIVDGGSGEPVDRANGGVLVSEIPTDFLDDDVVFLFHGCSTALDGESNFARSLFEHLNGRLKGGKNGPRVFGHWYTACPGQTVDWREYSRKSPRGSIRHTVIPWYRPPYKNCNNDR